MQFSINAQFSSFWHIDRTQSVATTPGQKGPGAPHYPKLQHNWSFTIRLFSIISGHSLVEFYFSAKMQSIYSAAPVLPRYYPSKGIQLAYSTPLWQVQEENRVFSYWITKTHSEKSFTLEWLINNRKVESVKIFKANGSVTSDHLTVCKQIINCK